MDTEITENVGKIVTDKIIMQMDIQIYFPDLLLKFA